MWFSWLSVVLQGEGLLLVRFLVFGLQVLSPVRVGMKGINAFLSLFKKIFKKDVVYLLLERGEGREKERERNSNVQEIH